MAEQVMRVQPTKPEVDSGFDTLVGQVEDFKKEEKRNMEARINVETLLVDQYFGRKSGGSKTLKSDTNKVKIEYPVYVKTDTTRLAECKHDIGEDDFKQITKPSVEYSASGYAALVKRLETEALTDIKAKNRLKKLKEAVQKHFDFDDGKPSVKIEKL